MKYMVEVETTHPEYQLFQASVAGKEHTKQAELQARRLVREFLVERSIGFAKIVAFPWSWLVVEHLAASVVKIPEKGGE